MIPNMPAFPVLDQMGDGPQGMTLRDYFAAKAMQALLPTIDEQTAVQANEVGRTISQFVAFSAYRAADAMIAERAK